MRVVFPCISRCIPLFSSATIPINVFFWSLMGPRWTVHFRHHEPLNQNCCCLATSKALSVAAIAP